MKSVAEIRKANQSPLGLIVNGVGLLARVQHVVSGKSLYHPEVALNYFSHHITVEIWAKTGVFAIKSVGPFF
jgi:hypothetical protein